MDEEEQIIHEAWMNDESGQIDLCLFCVDDFNHPVGAECTMFRWNGKKLHDVYPNYDAAKGTVYFIIPM